MQNLRTVINYKPLSHFGSFSNKCPKGKKMPLKSDTITYLFGFNGQERDDEVSGVGNINTAEFWEYDARLGRRWNLDPETGNYSNLSPYCTYNNNPNYYKDPNGLEGEPVFSKKETRRMNKYDRKAKNLSKRTKKTGEDLGNAMEEKYGDKKWMYVKDNNSFNNGTSQFTSIRDLAEYRANSTSTSSTFEFSALNAQNSGLSISVDGLPLLSYNMSGSGAFQINSTVKNGSISLSVYQGNVEFNQNQLLAQININSSSQQTITFDPSIGSFITVKLDQSKMSTTSSGTIGFAASTTIAPKVETIYKLRPAGITITNGGNKGVSTPNVYKILKNRRGF
jgi:RHS repeat-associated protein